VEKGPAADVTEALQLQGFSCNLIIIIIIIIIIVVVDVVVVVFLFLVMEHRWNVIDRGRPE
jgi:flagellar basal body-associated protein FliL